MQVSPPAKVVRSGMIGQVTWRIKCEVMAPLAGEPGTKGTVSALAPSVLGRDIGPKPIKLPAWTFADTKSPLTNR